MKVLIAIDSSPFSSQVLDAVSARRWRPDTAFRVVTFVEPHCGSRSEDEFLHQSTIIQSERVAQLRKKLPDCNIAAEAAVGSAGMLIIQTAAEWHADLIILGSHGDSGIRKSQIGS